MKLYSEATPEGGIMTFEEAQELVMNHLRARKWDKTNDSRGLAISLSLEAKKNYKKDTTL